MDLMILDFLNQDWLNKHAKNIDRDILFNKKWFGQQLDLWSFRLDSDLTEEQILELISLRSQLKLKFDKLLVNELDFVTEILELNRELQETPLHKKIVKDDSYHFIYEPINYDYTWLKFNILSSFGDLLTQVDKDRLRVCENPDCQFLFYDTSKNSTKRHCHSNCSNLMKARRYRERNSGK